MKRVIILTLAAAVIASAMTAGAQTRTLTLDDCRRMAIENNAKVKMAKNSAEAAVELKKEAYTKYFPTVSAQGLGFLANKPVLSYNFNDMFTLGIIKKGYNFGLTAIQPVFAGGRIINGNKLAQVGVEAGELEQQGAVDDVALTAEKYYWQIVTLKSKRSTLESVLQMVDTLAYEVNTGVKAGVLMRNDLLKVQLQQNNFRSLMVDLDNGITLSSQLLAQYVGLDGDTIDIVTENVPEIIPPFPSDLYIEPGEALATTTDYRLLNKKVEAAELQVKMTAGENLPTVGVGGGLFYDDLLNENYTFGAVFLSVSVPISGWWGGSHAIKRSKSALESSKIEREDLSQMLMLNMRNTWNNLTAAHRKMDIAHQSIGQALENLRINRNTYHAGVSNISDLLEAQTQYTECCDAYTDAYGTYRMARASYLDATGRAMTE